MATLAERFASKVEPVTESGCWIWMGSLNNRGYGQFYDGLKVQLAHRVSYWMHKGEIPANDNVLHQCDNPACVNPDHLFSGSQAENLQDMKDKKRRVWKWTQRGSAVSFSRLSADQVIEIREKYASGGNSQRSLAVEYGVSQPAIGAVVRRDVWKHI